MPKISSKKSDIEVLYNQLLEKTDNLNCINKKILAENPQYIKIFRFLIGKSLTEFGSLLKKTYATISQYERGKIKSIPLIESSRMAKIIKKNYLERNH